MEIGFRLWNMALEVDKVSNEHILKATGLIRTVLKWKKKRSWRDEY